MESQVNEVMAYVAVDKTLPGKAWAAAVDKPEYVADTAEAVAAWIKAGAIVERVPVKKAREMLANWMCPEDRIPSPQPTDHGA